VGGKDPAMFRVGGDRNIHNFDLLCGINIFLSNRDILETIVQADNNTSRK
jgi:hypothetical protein